MCKIRQSCNHFSSADPQMNLQPQGFGASVGLMKRVATAGGSLLVRIAQVVGEQHQGEMWRCGGILPCHLLRIVFPSRTLVFEERYVFLVCL